MLQTAAIITRQTIPAQEKFQKQIKAVKWPPLFVNLSSNI